MNQETSGNTAFRELEAQNPAVARAFRAFRQHAQPPVPSGDTGTLFLPSAQYFEFGLDRQILYHCRPRLLWTAIAVLLLTAGIVALGITVGPSFIRFFAQQWKTIILPVGCVCLGAGIVLLVSRLGIAPLRGLAPPDQDTEDPLQELKDLAERTASRLRSTYRFQLSAIVIVGAVFVGLIVWSTVMVSQKRILYASAFGSGGVAMLILTQWKWQPFDRINQARRLVDNADTLATGLRLRMQTISEIQEPRERAKAQWEAVEQYIDRS